MSKSLYTFLRKPTPAPPRYNLIIHVTSLPELADDEPVYITGTFNNWNPAYMETRLTNKENGRYYIEIPGLEAGIYEFKFTRGSWETVELSVDGTELKNRTAHVQAKTVLYITITRWKGLSEVRYKLHTASKNVHIINSAFSIPQLNRTRRIWVYLPESYFVSKRRYPVLYMHDGQNLFDEFTAYSGEWGVDETLDNMQAECIVIGIDNGGHNRINEYNPDDHPQFGKGEGRLYLEFIVATLKPFVDKNYRTLRGKLNTYIAGSSMGGLISFYAGGVYPDIFGRIGVFSPSFAMLRNYWKLIPDLVNKKKHSSQSYYFYAGGLEHKNMVRDMRLAIDLLRTHSRAHIEMVIDEEGRHNEAAWRKEFPAFYQWILHSMK
ncbi:MAG: alpha/beta hydrolase-fold protein [Chitinophagaceae bacterium]